MNKSKADPIVKTSFRLRKSMLKQVQQYGLDNDMNDTDIFVAALRNFLPKPVMSEGHRELLLS